MLETGALIPIRDINPRVRVPWGNYVLILLCICAFVVQLNTAKSSADLLETYGFVPGNLAGLLEYWTSRDAQGVAVGFFLSPFFHVGWIHIGGNLLYLRVFGDNVEDSLGHVRYIAFFFLCCIAGNLAQFLFEPSSSRPIVGASGGIAGILGYYITKFPRARVLTLFPALVVLMFIEVHASAFIGIWCLQQFLNGFLLITSEVHQTDVAWFAHIGGFTLGVCTAILLRLVQSKEV